MRHLTKFESDILQQGLQILRNQPSIQRSEIENLTVTNETTTKVGFYLILDKCELLKIGAEESNAVYPILDVELNGKIPFGVNFYTKNGYIDMIEGFLNVDDCEWPIEITNYNITES